MQNSQQPANNNFSEYGDSANLANSAKHANHTNHAEHAVQQAEIDLPVARLAGEQRQLDSLLGAGFTWEEAVKLLHQRTHLYENSEMQQRMADDCRIHFARWLYENGEINEA